jgi:hypothetical protein
MAREPISEEWIEKYVGQLIDLAARLAEGPMRDATLLRVDHILDLVKAFRERKK